MATAERTFVLWKGANRTIHHELQRLRGRIDRDGKHGPSPCEPRFHHIELSACRQERSCALDQKASPRTRYIGPFIEGSLPPRPAWSIDFAGEIDASSDGQTTCDQNPSCADQTSTDYQPEPVPQSESPAPTSYMKLTPRHRPPHRMTPSSGSPTSSASVRAPSSIGRPQLCLLLSHSPIAGIFDNSLRQGHCAPIANALPRQEL